MFKSHKKLTAAVLLSCACLMAPYYAHAEESEVNLVDPADGHKSNIHGIYVDNGNTHFVNLDLYTDENDSGSNFDHEGTPDSFRPLMAGEINVITNSMQSIKDLLGTPTNVPTIQFLLWADTETNAGATSDVMANGKTALANYFDKNALTYLDPEDYAATIQVNKGTKNIWEMSRSPVLNDNGEKFNYFATMTHEVFHALGISSNAYWVDAYGKATESPTNSSRLIIAEAIPAEEGAAGLSGTIGEQSVKFIASNYQSHLRDVFGNSPYKVDNPTSASDFREVTSITIDQFDSFKSGNAKPDDNKFYIIRNGFISKEIAARTTSDYSDSAESEETPGISGSVDDKLNSFGGVYFTGDNVNKVLNEAKIAWPDDYSNSLAPVNGLPINCYEDDNVSTEYQYKSNIPDLSHVELQNGFMSHQNYRNWGTFMEAELALLQDIGLDIDRNKFFGQSVYNSGESSANPFKITIDYKNNAYYDSTTNTYTSSQARAIGTHLYGSYIDAVQQGNVNVSGEYGVGIRVDGESNNLTINSNINANGTDGNALMVTYGKEHNVTLSQGASLSATGENGVAARFDFGSNLLGDGAEYRGSYIKAYYQEATPPSSNNESNEGDNKENDNSGSIEVIDTGNKDNTNSGLKTETIPGEETNNLPDTSTSDGIPADKESITQGNTGGVNGYQNVAMLAKAVDDSEVTTGSWVMDENIPDAINGELVTNFNVAGTLKGQQAAIYISENALVKNINILNGADIQGDIISKWNPNKIKYQNDDSATLTPKLDGKNGLTNLTFGGKYIEPSKEESSTTEGSYESVDSNFNLSYGGNIQGADSIEMRIAGGTLNYSGTAEVLNVTINKDATLGGTGTYTLTEITEDTPVEYAQSLGDGVQTRRGTFTNNGTFDLGDGIQNISITGNYNQTSDGTLGVDFNSDAGRDTLTVHDGQATIAGTIKLTPQVDYYFNGQTIKIDKIVSVNGGNLENSVDKPDINNISPVLKFTVADNNSTYDGFQCNYADTKYIINVERVEQGYQSVADDKISAGIGSALDSDAKNNTEKLYVGADKLKLIQAIDFPLTVTTEPEEKKKVLKNNLKKLNPNVVGSQAQAVLETHTTLNNLVAVTSLVNTGSMSINIPTAIKRGGLGPTQVEPPKYNSWRNIVIPFAAYTNQHNGTNGYTNHNSGVIGAMERTFANGLTHGYHAAINHQSTEDSGSTIKGEGIYLGTHASYAPEEWNGWSVFGSARLGVEQMRSHRRVYISDSLAPYIGTADGDWTGYSGSLNIGAALTKEHGVMRSGPFAALDYSFAHRPSVHEDGGAVRTNLESATYDSLRTQLGYRLVTNPKALHSYDSTQWQAHASVAWNHELLSDNGRTNYQLVEFPGATIEDDIETYGRDSMSIAGGVIFKTPNRLDVGLTLGSDIYRKGGSSIYGKVNFEWKF